jgi:DNA-binding FrmR family transcriptional regulator
MSTTTEPLQLQQLDTRIKAVWQRGQMLHLTAGALALVRWAVLLFLVAVAVDWMMDMPVAGRIVILITLLAVSLYKAWQGGWRNLRAFDATHTALQVEKHHGGLESLLVSAVQLRDPAAVAGASEALRDRTCRLAEEAAETLRPNEAVPYQGLRHPALLAMAFVLIIGVFAVVNGPFLAAGFSRIFAPWLAVEYPTYTQLDLDDGDLIVKEGDGIRLQARVSGVIPAAAELTLRTGKGKPRVRSLAIDEGACEYPLESVFRSFEYRITAGDARSSWHRVRVISSPRIERAEVRIEFPAYTQRPTETVEALTVTVPEGTRMYWKLTLDRAVSKAEFRPDQETAMPLEVSSDGRSVTMQQVAAESRAYSFGWVGKEHGFAFDSPRHYVQVAPDRSPHVELTSPKSNLYATLQRKLNLAFRARDDHGIGETVFAYRVNKTSEVKVPISQGTPSDGSEQQIDWNYHEALSDLAVGDTLSFAVELTDRYPGAEGPHRARSDVRRLQFLSKEDYLQQIEKQKRRLLARLRTIYREERAIYNIVSSLDPSDDVFIQTCQLEAVRQDLMRDRLNVLRSQINDLVEDLAANNISDTEQTASLVQLASGLQAIGDEHVGRAASMLRELTAVSDEARPSRDPAPAIHMVNSAARELALLVFQLGFRDAADVMARELHATAQTQAALRLRTIVLGRSDVGHRAGNEELAKAQTRLAAWCTRLLAAAPRNKESTSNDALVAFNLSRLTTKLLGAGTTDGMREAAALIPQAESEKAVRLQAEAIAALLDAEFRLRRGAEYEALTYARDLFAALAAGQRKLREEGADKSAEKLAQSQAALHLLLMPEVPASRPKLYDVVAPSAPPVDDLLAAAEHAMRAALTQIEAGDRAAAAGHHQQAQTAFEKLAEIASWRMEAMTKRARMKAAVIISEKQAVQLLTFEERLLVLLEQTEDAADDDEAKTAFLAALNQALADDAERFLRNIVRWKEAQTSPSEDDLALIDCLSRVARAVGKATPFLKENKPDDAIEFQEHALDALEEAAGLNEELTATRTTFADVLSLTESVLVPSPKLAEIEAEQIDMAALTEKAKPEQRPSLVIPQKNLIHAVQAVVNSLDPLAHKIESGTVLLFAKEDMDAAAIGLETDDIEDALDAQSFVVESLQELRAKIDEVTPQYRYVLEVTENLYEIVPQSARIRTGTRQLLEKAEGAPDAAAVKTQTKQFGELLQKLTGEEGYVATVRQLENAIDSGAAGAGVEDALQRLIADTEKLQLLMDNLAYLIAPPLDLANIPVPTPEIRLLEDVLMLAAHHKDLSRRTRTATPEQLADFAAQQRKFASKCAAFIPMSKSHPHLVAAHRHLSEAVAKLEASNHAAAISSQHEAGEMLRYFILEYALKYVMIPPPGPPQDPAPPTDVDELVEQEILPLFEPGALTGDKPNGGRLEWQVLGRRDRAALNENFARELPLEYRAILKDYYERLTQ